MKKVECVNSYMIIIENVNDRTKNIDDVWIKCFENELRETRRYFCDPELAENT